jgi:ATP-binding cassette, subfamily B, multidrug efflux pump
MRDGGTSTTPAVGKSLRRVFGYLRPHTGGMAAAAAAMLLVSAANLITPQLLRHAIDSGATGRNGRALLVAVAGLCGVALGRGVFTFLQEFLTERAAQGVAYELREALFAKAQRLGFGYFDHARSGGLLTRHTDDVEIVRMFAGPGVLQLAAALFMLSGSTLLLLRMNWRLTLISFVTVPLVVALLIRMLKRVGPLFAETQRWLERLNNLLQESLVGARAIRAYGREGFEAARYRAADDAFVAGKLAVSRALSDNLPLAFFCFNLGVVAVIWYGGFQVIGGRMTIGELVAFNSYLGLLLFPVVMLGFLLTSAVQAGFSATRIFELLDADIEVRDAPDAQALTAVTGRVEFRDVHFGYPGGEREVLRGLDLTVEPGQIAAVLGATGSGKSTLLNLLPRFYDVTSGSVCIDGHDVRTITLNSLRSHIAVVLQETVLFSGTVRDNIAYGRPDSPFDEIEQAARDAQADEFIRTLPHGYDTVIGERGVGLSGGQRQRIAIARALLIRPRLLILDDSTSAVDAGTEALIRESLDRLLHDRRHTTFVIAHRVSTIRAADIIFLLDEGRVAARGTHEELLRESRLYNEILDSQLSTEADPSPFSVPGH